MTGSTSVLDRVLAHVFKLFPGLSVAKALGELNNKLPVLNNKYFTAFINLACLANVIALLFAVQEAWFAPSTEGLSPVMWTIFLVIQIATMLEAVKRQSPALFLSMVISALETGLILLAIAIRG